jgi:hypothetical protein
MDEESRIEKNVRMSEGQEIACGALRPPLPLSIPFRYQIDLILCQPAGQLR